MLYILAKVQVIVGEGAAHIIIELITALRQLLELGNNDVIASLSASVRTHFVIYCLTSVNAEDHIGHFFINKLLNLVVEQDSVGRQGKTEFLMIGLLQAPAVGYQVFYHLPVHQRLAAEEIHLKIHPAAGIGNQKIQGLFPHFKAHQGASAVIFPFLRKAVAAGKVAVMGNMQAQGLDHGLTFFKIHHEIMVNVLCQKLFHVNQLLDILQRLPQFLRCISAPQAVKYI